MDYKKLVKTELSKIECGEFSKIEDVKLISDLGIDIMTNIVKKLSITGVSYCDFATWLRDNYSTNKEQGKTEPLPKGIWRKDFTNEHYTIEVLFRIYLAK